MPLFAYWASPQDWLVVGVVVMVLFGGTKIPEFAKGIGEGMREFKRAIDGEPEKTPTAPESPARAEAEPAHAAPPPAR
jgi:sec-independent protein translocase protein TatA